MRERAYFLDSACSQVSFRVSRLLVRHSEALLVSRWSLSWLILFDLFGQVVIEEAWCRSKVKL